MADADLRADSADQEGDDSESETQSVGQSSTVSTDEITPFEMIERMALEVEEASVTGRAPPPAVAEPSPPELPCLKVMTYNIGQPGRDQIQMIADLVNLHQVDVVVFQEVTLKTLKAMKSKLYNYLICECLTTEGYPEGVCVFCRKDTVSVSDVSYYDLPDTQMSRHVIDCEIKYQRHRLHVLGLQLEGMPEHREQRSQQFRAILEIIKDYHHVIVAGDWQIYEPSEPLEWQLASSPLVDAWKQLGSPSHLKYTYDYRQNKQLRHKVQARMDRICWSSRRRLSVQRLDLLGVGAHPPADHYALLAHIQLS